MYEVIGIQFNRGVSKKTGKPYNFLTVHCKVNRPQGELEGICTAKFDFNLEYYPNLVIPSVGDNVEVSFNYKGYCNNIFIL